MDPLGSWLAPMAEMITEKYIKINTIQSLWNNMPTYLALEILAYVLCAVTIIHARASSRKVVWFTSFACIAVTELYWSTKPEKHLSFPASGVVMLMCKVSLVRICLQHGLFYMCATGASTVRLAPDQEALAAAFISFILYIPFAMCGSRFVWWTYHASDPLVGPDARIFDIPYVALIFTIVTTGYLTRVSHWVGREYNDELLKKTTGLTFRDQIPEAMPFLTKLVASVITTVVSFPAVVWFLCMLEGTFMQTFELETPSLKTVGVTLLVLIFFVSKEWQASWASGRTSGRFSGEDQMLALMVILWSCTIFGFLVFGDSSIHQSTGPHQPKGSCKVTDFDLFYRKRAKNVCDPEYIRGSGGPTTDYIVSGLGNVCPWVTPEDGTGCNLTEPAVAAVFTLIAIFGAIMVIRSATKVGKDGWNPLPSPGLIGHTVKPVEVTPGKTSATPPSTKKAAAASRSQSPAPKAKSPASNAKSPAPKSPKTTPKKVGSPAGRPASTGKSSGKRAASPSLK